MRRGYDPSYGSRQQLRDSTERNMAIARERDKLKTENNQMTGHIQEMQWRIEELTEKLNLLEVERNKLFIENAALTVDLEMLNETINGFVDVMLGKKE
jgi:uncharacterized coiled-coil DUF342 family protein